MTTLYTFGDSILDCGRYNDHDVNPGALIVQNRDDLFPEFRGRDLSSRGRARLEHRAKDGSVVRDLPGQATAPRGAGAGDRPGDRRRERSSPRTGRTSPRTVVDVGLRIEEFAAALDRFLAELPIRRVYIGNVYDPTLGDDTHNFLGVDPALARAYFNRLNEAIAAVAARHGTLVDLHAHFLTGDRSWFEMNIEPSLTGASEVRRCFLDKILGGPGWGVGVRRSSAAPASVGDPPRSLPPDAGLLRWRLDRMEVLGIPKDWEAVRLALHPFSPERVLILPSDGRLGYGDRCGRDVRDRIDQRIDSGRSEMRHGPAPLPGMKREAILWIIDRLTAHYHRPDLFEEWAVELADRESLSPPKTGRHVGLAYQYQYRGEVAVDCPPLDWWLVLIPDGLDWASPDGESIHALITHVGRVPFCAMEGRVLDRALELTCLIANEVADWRGVGAMGRMAACRHLNPIAARLLEAMDF